ncbi:unnamed protein product [Alopecurus aequalis]
MSLRKYGRDMTAAAGKADPVIGRDDEIDRVICILCRRTKNCAALVGAAGVGKTAIAEGLAQRIATGPVPAALAGARVVEVDLGAVVAGTIYCGMFEERMKDVLRQAEDADGKMHMLLGSGGSLVHESGTYAANMLKPALARGRIRCVAATTLDEYSKYIEKDAALERRFQKVHVEEPSTQATIAILRGLKKSSYDHQDGGQLTEKVRRRPYSVILFDEVEKADPSVLNIFLRILDDGMLTDGKGRIVDFKNTIIIMTSNLGSDHLVAGMSGENTTETARDLLMKQVQKHFKPELLNRLSAIVVFDPLTRDNLKEIVSIQMKSVIARVAEKGISLCASDAALDIILSESYNTMYGARPIRRWVQENVVTMISEMLVRGEAGEGSTISIDPTDDKKGLKYEVAREVADPAPIDSGDDLAVATPVYDRASGTSGSRSNENSNTMLHDIAKGLSYGAAIVLCWEAWSYYQHSIYLGKYGRDMTASAGKADPVIGRDDEIDRVISILCRRTKNCAALVGAAGVGKTAIAEGLTQRIAAGTVPAALAGARVVELDLGAMVAGAMYRGMFEERMKNVIRQAEAANGKVILFMDEMHMLLGSGLSMLYRSSTDAANMLKPALARGRIRCVGATTLDEYSQYIEKDAALERRFQKVHVEEPSTQATIAILRGLKKRYEKHHGLEIHDGALVAAAQLAARYITGEDLIFTHFVETLLVDANRQSHLKRKDKQVKKIEYADPISLWSDVYPC